mgnify:CR=1 FL=1
MEKRLPAAVALLVLAGAASSCAATGGGGPLTEAEATEILGEVSSEVEAIRGLRFLRPVSAVVIDDARAREHVIRRFRMFYTEAESAARERALRLLGLLSPAGDLLGEYLDVLEEQAGGFYDPESEGFFLLGDMPRATLPMLASHELCHALEDQHFGLDERLRAAGNDDEIFAVSAVHEGSATLAMTAWTVRAAGEGKLRPADVRALQDSDAGRGERLAAMPEVSRVFGKVGRAETPTDPAPLSMVETVVQLHPPSTWTTHAHAYPVAPPVDDRRAPDRGLLQAPRHRHRGAVRPDHQRTGDQRLQICLPR